MTSRPHTEMVNAFSDYTSLASHKITTSSTPPLLEQNLPAAELCLLLLTALSIISFCIFFNCSLRTNLIRHILSLSLQGGCFNRLYCRLVAGVLVLKSVLIDLFCLLVRNKNKPVWAVIEPASITVLVARVL